MTEITLHSDTLDIGIPMHLLFDRTGQIVHVGPTLQKICPGLLHRPLDAAIRLCQPDLPVSAETLLTHAGRRLSLELLPSCSDQAKATKLRGVVFPTMGDASLLNCYLATEASDGVARHKLNANDFAPFDPTVELLFVMEARDVVLSEFRRLAGRLDVARQDAEKHAVTDKLTGLPNRRALDRYVASLCQNPTQPFGLMHVDLDHFKSVNDTLGHAAGDHVLSRVATVLRQQVRRQDLVARVGGDEFILLFRDNADVEVMRRIAERIITDLERPIPFQDNICNISASIGITMSGFYDHLDIDQMMADADAALYQSKAQGRARHCVARPTRRPAA